MSTSPAKHVSLFGLRYVFQRFALLTLFAVCLFVAAGAWIWPRAWAALIVCFVSESLVNLVLAVRAPETLNQRGSTHVGVKPFDRVFAVGYLILSMSIAAVAGFDCIRFGWTSLPWSTFVPGVALVSISTIVGTWSMVENEHFELFVRIQSERSHRVVTTGPYRMIRHPGYLAGVLGALAAPLLFGSVYTVIPACLMTVLIIWRTQREDTTLTKELPGYAD